MHHGRLGIERETGCHGHEHVLRYVGGVCEFEGDVREV